MSEDILKKHAEFVKGLKARKNELEKELAKINAIIGDDAKKPAKKKRGGKGKKRGPMSAETKAKIQATKAAKKAAANKGK